MADIAKVEFGGVPLIDLTSDTVEPADVLKDKTFHHKSGEIQKGTMENATLSASGSCTNAAATTTVAPGTVSIANNETAVSGKTRIGVTPATATTTISKYYIATKATAAANTTGATSTVSGSGTASASVSKAGYASASLTGSGTVSVSGTATAKTSAKDSAVTYLPIATGVLSASGEVSGSGSVTVTPGTVSVAGNDTAVSGKTRIAATPSTVTTGISTFYMAVKPSVAAGSGTGSVTASATVNAGVTTAGYVSNETATGTLSKTITVSGTSSAKDGSVYYIPVNTVATGVTVEGFSVDATKTPVLSRTAKPTSDTWTDAASGSATTTKPTSGPYVQIDAAANTATFKVTPKVTTAGYGTTTTYGATGVTSTFGSAKATTAYVPISTVTRAETTLTGVADDTNDKITYTAGNNQGTGWVTGANKTATKTVALTTSVSGQTVTATASDGTVSVSRTGTVGSGALGNVTTSTLTTAVPLVTTAGYITTQNISEISVPSGKSLNAKASGATTGSITIDAYNSSGTAENDKTVVSNGKWNAETFTPSESTQGPKYGRISCASITNTYVGSSITRRSSSDLTVSGAKVTAPAGYYASAAEKSIGSGSVSASASTGTASNYSIQVTPKATASAGYIAASTVTGTAVTINAATLGLTALAATTYNTSSSDQTIVTGKYLTGTQTIKAVTTSGIEAANIKAGETVKVGDANNAGRIKNVTGTYSGPLAIYHNEVHTFTATGPAESGYIQVEVKGSGSNTYVGFGATIPTTNVYSSRFGQMGALTTPTVTVYQPSGKTKSSISLIRVAEDDVTSGINTSVNINLIASTNATSPTSSAQTIYSAAGISVQDSLICSMERKDETSTSSSIHVNCMGV